MTTLRASTVAALVLAILARQEIRFLLAGAYNTSFGYLAFLFFYWTLGEVLGATPCLFISYVPSLMSAYLVQKYFVFHPAAWIPGHETSGRPLEPADTGNDRRSEFLRFAAVNTSVLLINLLFLPLAIRYGGMKPPVAQALFLVLAVIGSYFAHRYFSFRMRPRQ
jgi:putative flippase GtrA